MNYNTYNNNIDNKRNFDNNITVSIHFEFARS